MIGKSENVLEKLDEEILEFKGELNKKEQASLEEEFGDILFSLINLSRHYKINPYDALEKSNKKFTKRFKFIEQKINEANKNYDLDLKEIDYGISLKMKLKTYFADWFNIDFNSLSFDSTSNFLLLRSFILLFTSSNKGLVLLDSLKNSRLFSS